MSQHSQMMATATIQDDDFSRFFTPGACIHASSVQLVRCTELPVIPELQPSQLELRDCFGMTYLPSSIAKLTGLTSLSISGSSLQTLPDQLPTTLRELSLFDCEELVGLPDTITQLKALQQLRVFDCGSLPMLPRSLGLLTCLCELSIACCRQLRSLPAGIGLLSRLDTLDLQGCEGLASLPSSMSQLSSLTRLQLAGCTGLKTLPLSVMMITALQHVELGGCQLQELGPLQFPQLTYLSLKGCRALERVEELTGVPQLQSLDLSGCCSLVRVPESVSTLACLTALDLSGCSSLTALPTTVAGMAALEQLKLRECGSISSLPLALPASLTHLDLSYCSEMPALANELLRTCYAAGSPGAEVCLQGWGRFVAGLPTGGTIVMDVDWAHRLHRAVNIHRLVTDRELVMELLARFAWLGVMFGAATFTAAIAPPGGFENGLPFLKYSERDCPYGMNQTAGYSSVVHCNVTAVKQNCSISDADPGGCIKRPDSCTDIEGVSCRVKPDPTKLNLFFTYDVMSFWLALLLVVWVVACSIPRSRGRPAAEAARVWFSLAVAAGLLTGAVCFGGAALYYGLFAIYPKGELTVVWAMVTGVFLVQSLLGTVAQLERLSPGAAEVRRAVFAPYILVWSVIRSSCRRTRRTA